MESKDAIEQQLQCTEVAKEVKSESNNTTYLASRKPLNEDEFERLPEYVQQFLIQQENGELEPVNKEDLKSLIYNYFQKQKDDRVDESTTESS